MATEDKPKRRGPFGIRLSDADLAIVKRRAAASGKGPHAWGSEAFHEMLHATEDEAFVRLASALKASLAMSVKEFNHQEREKEQ